MINYLKGMESVPQTKKTFGGLDLMQDKMRKELQEFKQYMFRSNKRVNNNNMLVRFISNVSPNLTLPYAEYVSDTISKVRASVDVFGFITNSSKGVVYRNDTNKVSHDLYYELDNKQSLFFVEDWKQLEVIKIIYTTDVNIDFYSYGLEADKLPHTNIIGIDPRELLVAYRGWAIDRHSLDLDTNPTLFIATYLLPKLWDTKIDMVILNRYMASRKDEKMPPSHDALPYYVPDFDKMVDKYHKKLIKHVDKTPAIVSSSLNSLPTINNINVLLPLKKVLTSKSKWVMWYGRMDFILMVLDSMVTAKHISINRMFLGKLRTNLKRYKNSNITAPNGIPMTFKLDVELGVMTIEEKINELNL